MKSPYPVRRRVRLVAAYLQATAAVMVTGASIVTLGLGVAAATPAPIGGTGSADFPSLPLSQSAYTGSAGSSDTKVSLPIADSGSSGSGDSGSGLGSAGSDGNIASPGNGNTLSSGAVGDGSSESGNRNTAHDSQSGAQPLDLGPAVPDPNH
ncbi:hypothetical protein [Nocardia sp. NPDC056100]|uniref:hypothetical protein n=1 Tax=Nocardia sp. NPDC056100 TaxID=3345712 RepID=UPI0035D569DD